MDILTLSEQERRWYWELFRLLDVDGSDQLPGAQTFDMFLSSGLQPEIVNQIVDLCGAKRLGHFGRNEFYIALKLISAAQNGYMPMLDICNSGVELPVPRFAITPLNADIWRTSQAVNRPPVNQPSQPQEQHFIYYERAAPAVHAPPQTSAVSMYQASRSMSLYSGSSDVPLLQEPCSPVSDKHDAGLVRKQSAPVVQHVVQSNNSVVIQSHTDDRKSEKGWAQFEEDCQGLINAADCKDWTQFAAETGKAADTASMSSESLDDVWCITDEQREYYVRQFTLMQDDLHGVISGVVAKEFFEKSKLPVQELSKIWQLSDVNRDGALSLDEFCTAMHLVVLRRNDIELPDTLPPMLQPYTPLVTSDLPADGIAKKISPTPSTSSQPWTTAFQLPESPTSSSVSSPGNKSTPVNFEFRPITADEDSKIVHPVPMRLSPDSQPFMPDAMTSSTYSDGGSKYSDLGDQQSSGQVGSADLVSTVSVSQSAVTTDLIDLMSSGSPEYRGQHLAAGHLQMRPRPTPPKKTQSLPGPTQLPPPPQAGQESSSFPASDRNAVTATSTSSVHDAGPALPRRPDAASGTHSRSTSLDNQLIDFSDSGGDNRKVQFPPVVPPRSSPKELLVGSPGNSSTAAAADLASNSHSEIDQQYQASRGHNFSKLNSLERWDLQASIRNQKERNMVLSRLNSELNQELQEVMEQRIALEIQMEHLRPYHS